MATKALAQTHGEPLRTVIFPNVDGIRYTLRTWDTGRQTFVGQTVIRYELQAARVRDRRGNARLLFSGEDFSGSPMHADDSDATMRSLLSFLTLRPGDTDASYFEGYTPDQIAFAECDAEALSIAVWDRFGDA